MLTCFFSVVKSPKNLLKNPRCKDSLDNFDDDAENDRLAHVRFKRLIMDCNVADRSPFPEEEPDVQRVLFCSGQGIMHALLLFLNPHYPYLTLHAVYFKVEAQRQKDGLQDRVHMVRIEQISPFPYDLVLRELRRYPNAEICWLQEEPKNMGAYSYVMPRIETCLRALDMNVVYPLPYIGRPSSAVPATGFAFLHQEEEADIIESALDLQA